MFDLMYGKMRVTGVTEIHITDIVPDVDSGGYTRTIMIYQDPVGAVNRKPTIEIPVYSDTKDYLEIMIPTGVEF